MRLPIFERDFWQLKSGEEAHRLDPTTFSLPPFTERSCLKRGQAAKLMFEIETQNEDGAIIRICERMWVIVSQPIDNLYIGILDNQPACVAPDKKVYLCFGAEIPFGPEHVVDIATPPTDYLEWQLSQPPERIWSRNE